ncbi:hypothetical protein [Dictyobacter kobayashii]|uniref:Uncharacterized protein n=1 Tax=Dictyobacter kobayashii TaxID=2014872 RepID=A0A402AJD3_9CHLR|nr:hypothetical protein [Dictyobacter kobayashii]GCE19206.1 hypothetical protein KDK_30060 [Dictyobacter kobayashii]
MNATLCPITDLDLEVCDLSVAIEDEYDTTPMTVVTLPQQQPVDEELLYAGFEEALSNRLCQWKRLSDGSLNSIPRSPVAPVSEAVSVMSVVPVTEPLLNDQVIALLRHNWQRSIIFVCLALMLILMGFDIMGMLVLSMR